MNTDSSFNIAYPPLAMLVDPKLLATAHERMSSRVRCTVYRPLDTPRLRSQHAVDYSDADAEAEFYVEGEEAVATFDWLDTLLQKLPAI